MNRAFIKYRLNSNKGFILAEVILAIFIISVALIPISGMFIQSLQADVMANHYIEAANLSQKQLELLKTHPPEYWAGLALPSVIPWQDNTQIPLSRYTLTSNARTSTSNDHLIEVTVTASWQERNTECNIQFVTLYPTL